jgi:asparagine synthase (glutamine-hydrolysing)
MCGIAGFTAPGADARDILYAMTEALRHRGPDAEDVFVDGGIALGHTRLAIIDLQGGAQPRVDVRTGDALVFNGEIYGYKPLADELRRAGIGLRDRSDTEVLFQLIRRDGPRRAIERIDGMFAFAYRDGASGTLYLARDRFGEKPLYYSLVDGQLIFASEASALRRHRALRAAGPDRIAAYRLLLFEYLPGRESGWEGIHKLEPGTLLSFRDGEIRHERYWTPRLEAGALAAVGEAEAAERLGDLLAAAIKRRLVADVPVGVFLSGGLDSSLITALAARAAADLTAFTVRFGEHSFDETAHAASVARAFGLRHEVVELSDGDLSQAVDAIGARLGEPLADSSLLPTYLLCRAARSAMTVALGGDGADELFAGYPNFAVQRFAPAMRLVPGLAGRLAEHLVAALPPRQGYMNWRFLLAQLSQGLGAPTHRQSFLWMAPFSPGRLASLWRRDALPDDALATAFEPIDRLAREDGASEDGASTGLNRLLRLFLLTYLPENILAKTDRASMFNSLEVRSPFLDRDVAAYASALPSRLKLKGGIKKHILKRVASGVLPDAIVHRRKHGFAVPIGALIRTVFRERCRDVLLSSNNPVASWFDRAAVEALLTQHLSGHGDHGKKLWAMFMLFVVAGQRAASAAPATDIAIGGQLISTAET